MRINIIQHSYCIIMQNYIDCPDILELMVVNTTNITRRKFPLFHYKGVTKLLWGPEMGHS
ncbi:hypothetical protein WN55_10538 [Dufourea novaeangliae]|uniref:Uncharacterized protein n=1 Tax=Dufourea novaeangliae TaxID=178035 RepID=A0A154P452_DUFNO|nr:hypothetical protein WN55_10538 [Dufourea novaeangliae]